MHAPDEEVIERAVQWLAARHRVALVTVARTWGSSPRPPGALLAVREDGVQAGSVSGGCVEADLVEQLQAGLAQAAPAVVRYGVDRAQAQRFGLPCGGRLELVVERLRDAGDLAPLRAAMRERRLVARSLDLETGRVRIEPADADGAFAYDSQRLTKIFGAAWRLLIIGATAPARYLAPLARSLDYRVTVCDPRIEVRAGWRDDEVDWAPGMPDDAVRSLVRDPRWAVVALTHDPKLDDLALLEALTSPAFYVAALGSHANNAQRRLRLAQLGVPAAALARLHGPAGLPIGSRTPPEIALAIAAEITALRHAAVAAPVSCDRTDKPLPVCGHSV